MTWVSVGIPTRNTEKTIEITIRSLLQQTRPPDRIIVVDDSEDSTPEIVKTINNDSEVQIDVFKQSTKGHGVGRARQDIYEYFDGDILACLDTELRVNNDWLEKRVAFHNSNPSFGVLSSTSQPKLEKEVTDLKSNHYFRQANCSLTASALDAVNGWDPWMPRGEDWDIHIRLARAGVRSYVMSDLDAECISSEPQEKVLQKTLHRPSSIIFLRKYGVWYLSFHPLHFLGEIASFSSVLCLGISGILAAIGSSLAFLPLIPPLLATSIFFHLRVLRNRRNLAIKRGDVVWAVVFLLLWISAARELLRSKSQDWNYGGIK